MKQLKKFFARYYHMDRLAVSALPNSIGLQPLPESHDSVLNAPIAVKYAKACIDRGMQMDIDDGIAVENELFAMCFATEDQKEGMGAFLEKRKEKHFQNK